MSFRGSATHPKDASGPLGNIPVGCAYPTGTYTWVPKIPRLRSRPEGVTNATARDIRQRPEIFGFGNNYG